MLVLVITLDVVILLFSVLLLIKIKARALLHLDILENHGYFSLNIYKKNVFAGKLHAEGTNLMLTYKNGKPQELHLNIKKDDKRSVSRYIREPLFCKIAVEDVAFYFVGGKNGDAFFTVMTAAAVQSAYNALAAVMLTKRPKTRLRGDIDADFYSDKLAVSVAGIFSADIADIIAGLLASVILHIRERRRSRRNDK